MKHYFKQSVYLSVVIITVILSAILTGCKEDDENVIPKETGTVTDIDNNTYTTVKIGNQWWMAEDLRVTKYRNGQAIPKRQTDSLQWSSDSVGAYCEVINNNQQLVGLFYNWHTINNPLQIAPEGWHIPSDEEWKMMESFLGMSSAEINKEGWRGTNEGVKLKIAAPLGWSIYGTVWGTNESGFAAYALGCRMFNGGWGEPGLFATGFWWTSSEYSLMTASYRYLDKKQSSIFRDQASKQYGFAIRCVKD
jgi:uncharacterized protein (TIGR02145 family)